MQCNGHRGECSWSEHSHARDPLTVPVQFHSSISCFPCKTRTRQSPSQWKQKKWSWLHSTRNKGGISCKSEGGKTFLALCRERKESCPFPLTLSYLHLWELWHIYSQYKGFAGVSQIILAQYLAHGQCCVSIISTWKSLLRMLPTASGTNQKLRDGMWLITIMIDLAILLLSNTSIRYQIKINNCNPVLRKTEMWSDSCVQVQRNQESALL